MKVLKGNRYKVVVDGLWTFEPFATSKFAAIESARLVAVNAGHIPANRDIRFTATCELVVPVIGERLDVEDMPEAKKVEVEA